MPSDGHSPCAEPEPDPGVHGCRSHMFTTTTMLPFCAAQLGCCSCPLLLYAGSVQGTTTGMPLLTAGSVSQNPAMLARVPFRLARKYPVPPSGNTTGRQPFTQARSANVQHTHSRARVRLTKVGLGRRRIGDHLTHFH